MPEEDIGSVTRQRKNVVDMLSGWRNCAYAVVGAHVAAVIAREETERAGCRVTRPVQPFSVLTLRKLGRMYLVRDIAVSLSILVDLIMMTVQASLP